MQWTEDLRVDGAKIDEQHRELFYRIGKLVSAIKSKTCKLEIGPTTEFLEVYVVRHFSDEERMMVDAGYEGYDEHKALHDKFIENFANLRRELEDEHSNYNKSVYTNQIVVDWIIEHINEHDKRFGRFLAQGTD